MPFSSVVTKYVVIGGAFMALIGATAFQKMLLDQSELEKEALNQSLIAMESSNAALEEQLLARSTDAQIRQMILKRLDDQRQKHQQELATARSETKVIVKEIIKTVVVENEPEVAAQVTQRVITNSYDCIEQATGSESSCVH